MGEGVTRTLLRSFGGKVTEDGTYELTCISYIDYDYGPGS